MTMRMLAAIIARLRFQCSGPGEFATATPVRIVRSSERACTIPVRPLPVGLCKDAGTESVSRMAIRYRFLTTRSYRAGVGFSANAREAIWPTSFGRGRLPTCFRCAGQSEQTAGVPVEIAALRMTRVRRFCRGRPWLGRHERRHARNERSVFRGDCLS
jgi:hypothetical protein